MKDETSQPPDPETILAEFLARVEDGEDVDLGHICREYPDHADALRSLYPQWQQTAKVVMSSPFPMPRQQQTHALQRLAGHGTPGAIRRRHGHSPRSFCITEYG